MILLRIAGLLVGTGFCVSAALALRRRLRMDGGVAGVLAFLLFFTAIQSLLVLAAGLSGLLSFWPLTLSGAVGWALLRLLKPPPLPPLPLPGAPSARILLLFAVAAVASLLVKTALLGPYTGDALSYHLPKIAEWVRAGRFVWGIHHDPRMWFPAGFELIETWWVVFLHHDALIELGGVQMALIAVAAVFSLAESLDLRPGLAAVAFLFLPAVILNATSCGNDLASAALILAGYAMVGRGAPRAVQAFPLLLAVGVKATGGFAAVGVVLYALWRRERPATELPRWGTAVLAGAGLLLGSFWYLRNWIVAGHPLYPFHGIHGEFTWMPQQGGFDIESLQSTIQAVPRRLLDRHPFESLSENAAGWGWGALPLGLPALLLALREDRRFRGLALSFVAGACLTFCFVWDDFKNLRFVMWFPALLALALARIQHPLWIGAALLACVLNFAATVVPYEARHSAHVQAPERVPPAEPIAVVFRDAAFSYRLYNRDFSRRVVYPRSMEELRASGVKVVQLYEPPDWAEPIRRWPALGKGWHEVR